MGSGRRPPLVILLHWLSVGPSKRRGTGYVGRRRRYNPTARSCFSLRHQDGTNGCPTFSWVSRSFHHSRPSASSVWGPRCRYTAASVEYRQHKSLGLLVLRTCSYACGKHHRVSHAFLVAREHWEKMWRLPWTWDPSLRHLKWRPYVDPGKLIC